MRFAGVVLAAFSIVPGAVHAQQPAFSSLMQEVNARVPVPDPAVIEADALLNLQAIAKEKGGCAPTGVSLGKITPATADMMAVKGVQSGQILNLWLAEAMTSGCPKGEKPRFMILAFPDGKVIARLVNFGSSIAWPSLFRDAATPAAMQAFVVARAANPGCDPKSLDLLSTRVVSTSPDISPDFFGVRFAGSWDEAWLFAACGQVAEATLQFRADGNGGAYYDLKHEGVRLLDPAASK